MCGIVGFTSAQTCVSGVLDDMAQSLRHRGPDADGFYSDSEIAFGHRRLTVIAPDGGAQPWEDANTGDVLIYNGEIYGSREQAELLKQQGIDLTDNSDTEVLFKTIQHCGIDDAETLKDIVSRENAAILSGDRSHAIRLAGEFHLRLAEVAGNKPIHDLLRQLVAQSSLALALYEAPGHLLCVDNDHVDIVTAQASGNIKKNRELIEQHLYKVEAEMKIDQPKDSNNLKSVFADIIENRASA